MFENAVAIAGSAQKSFTATGGAQYASKLEAGVYDIWADDNVYLKVDDADASDVTTGTGYLLKSGNTVPVRIASPAYLGAIGAGDVYFHKVD